MTGLLYTIPSLAAFAVLRPIFGLTLITAIVPADHVHAADPVPQLRGRVQLRAGRDPRGGRRDGLHPAPAAASASSCRCPCPLIIAGIRLASVTTIGLATIAAVLGDTFGGLGQLITEGIQTFFPTKYLLGAALSVILAFAADFLFVRFERIVTPWAHAKAGAR